jgi:septum formation protein
MSQLILASQSPRRRELLATAGFQFIVRSRPVEEIRAPGESPVEYVRRLARAKAEACRDAHGSADEIVLGADTVVVLGDRVLEKPVDADDARGMLQALSGREHVVITGICLMHANKVIADHESTCVHFVELADAEIDAYVLSGEPMDKAGAYAIQGLASKFVDRIEGCYFNVMGLPLARVYRHWKAIAP